MGPFFRQQNGGCPYKKIHQNHKKRKIRQSLFTFWLSSADVSLQFDEYFTLNISIEKKNRQIKRLSFP